MITLEATVLFRPDTPELAYLPEAPRFDGLNRLVWVGIQHGERATNGSLNLFDLQAKTNRTYPLKERPGFAFPTPHPAIFLLGMEKNIGLYDIGERRWTSQPVPVENDVKGTIINDGFRYRNGVIFGTKDLEFKTRKAGLYFLRFSTNELTLLRSEQICSNGKALVERAGQLFLLDIDTPTRKVAEYPFDEEKGVVGPPRIALDLARDESLPDDALPDGMVLSPDGQSVIIAMYNRSPDALDGEARMYDLASGKPVFRWKTELSPKVTCPLLLKVDGRVKLVLTTAADHAITSKTMRWKNAGSIFIADSPFSTL